MGRRAGARHGFVAALAGRGEVQEDLGRFEAALASAHAEAEGALGQVGFLRESANLAGESLRLTLLRYQAGEATAFEVTDAQSTVKQARDAYDDGLARYRIALASLRSLMGTL